MSDSTRGGGPPPCLPARKFNAEPPAAGGACGTGAPAKTGKAMACWAGTGMAPSPSAGEDEEGRGTSSAEDFTSSTEACGKSLGARMLLLLLSFVNGVRRYVWQIMISNSTRDALLDAFSLRKTRADHSCLLKGQTLERKQTCPSRGVGGLAEGRTFFIPGSLVFYT